MSTCGAERRSGGGLRSRPAVWLVPGFLCLAMTAAAAAPAPEPRVGTHRVKRGETLATLAEKYYGERARADLLARVNGLQREKPLRAGQLLKVPFSAAYKVKPGDTPSALAEKWLGGSSRHALLLEMNSLPARGPLPAGAEIELPALLSHTLARGETLGEVAQRIYGEAARAAWIAQCSDLERPDQVKRGQRLLIPLVGALPARRLPGAATSSAAAAPSAAPSPSQGDRSQRPAAGKAARGSKAVDAGPPSRPARPGAPADAERDPAVERAVVLYHQGEYSRAGALLDAALESGALKRGEKIRALRFRAYCGVATGDRAAAARAFRDLQREAPGWKPDPIEDSPKIRHWHAEALASRRS